MVTLRVVTTDDWPLWRDLRVAALTESPHAFKARVADWHRGGEEEWRARFGRPGAHHLVAFLDGRGVGLARGVPVGDGVSELRSLWAGSRVRGRGAGDLLLGAVEAWARGSGAATLRLTVIPGNDHAMALYRRHGFAVTTEHGPLLPDGVTRELVMAKALR
ncbi:GNAT family N-acetyltransferase [Streptomyces mashuensis]|nr:GNAT family N-acetyltransferase [Streptomyces mashuensis]